MVKRVSHVPCRAASAGGSLCLVHRPRQAAILCWLCPPTPLPVCCEMVRPCALVTNSGDHARAAEFAKARGCRAAGLHELTCLMPGQHGAESAFLFPTANGRSASAGLFSVQAGSPPRRACPTTGRCVFRRERPSTAPFSTRCSVPRHEVAASGNAGASRPATRPRWGAVAPAARTSCAEHWSTAR